jgi:hypothetical protein
MRSPSHGDRRERLGDISIAPLFVPGRLVRHGKEQPALARCLANPDRRF